MSVLSSKPGLHSFLSVPPSNGPSEKSGGTSVSNGLTPKVDLAVAKLVTNGGPTPAAGTPAAPATSAAPANPPPYVKSLLDPSLNAHLNYHQQEMIAVLRQHADALPADPKDIPEFCAKSTTPPDLKKALLELFADPSMQKILHAAAPPVVPPPYVVPPLDTSLHPKLNDHQLETVSVLQRHRDLLPFELKAIPNLIANPATPPDLKQALQELSDDPTLRQILDAVPMFNGAVEYQKISSHYEIVPVATRDLDGKCGEKEIDFIAAWPELVEHNAKKAETYSHTYVPSETKDVPAAVPREITANDAAREMYLYSDSLPEDLDPGVLQAIINGQLAGKGKCPPQLIAAAVYFLHETEEWAKLAVDKDGRPGAGGKVSRGAMLDMISKNVFVTQEENDALKTITNHRETFFGGGLDRGEMQKIIDNPATLPDVKAAAQKLLDDPLLFGMIDNASRGHEPSEDNEVDDGKLGLRDFDVFMSRLTTKDKTPPPLPPAKAPDTPEAAKALTDMRCGAIDDPAIKVLKGGEPPDFWDDLFGGLEKMFNDIGDAFKKFGNFVADFVTKTVIPALEKAADAIADFVTKTVIPALEKVGKDIWHFVQTVGAEIIHVVAEVMHYASIALSMLSKIPIIGEFAIAASLAVEAMGGGLDIAVAGIKGEDVEKAAEMAALGLAAAVLGNLLVPAAGAAILKVAEKTGATAAVTAIAETASRAVEPIVTPIVNTVKAGAEKVAAPFVRAANAAGEAATSAGKAVGGAAKSVASKASEPFVAVGTEAQRVTRETMERLGMGTTAERAAIKQSTRDSVRQSMAEGRDRVAAPFIKAAESVSATKAMIKAQVDDSVNAVKKEASDAAAWTADKASKARREASYKLGLSTPEKDAKIAAGKAEKEAVEAEVAAADARQAEKEAEEQAAKEAADPSLKKKTEDFAKKQANKEERKELKDEIKDELEDSLTNRLLRRLMASGPIDLAGLSATDIALLMALQRQMQKTFDETPAAKSHDKSLSKAAPVVQQSLKSLSKAMT